MKRFLVLFSVLVAVLMCQSCKKQDDNPQGIYNFKGGLSATLPKEHFGTVKEVPLDSQSLLEKYKVLYPDVNKIEIAMYDNFNTYNGVGFSYAYTEADTNIFETDTPFGFDNVQDIIISGKPCKRSSTVDLEQYKTLTMVSCKDNNRSWDIFIQSFHAVPQTDAAMTEEQNEQITDATEEVNDDIQAVVDAAISSFDIQ